MKDFVIVIYITNQNKKKGKEVMSEININTLNFEEEVIESDKPVLLDFWATWCGPCRMVSPIIEEIAEENTDVKVGKVNVDDQPELAARFGITSIPTLMVFKDGEVANQSVGYQSKDQILSMLK